MKNRLTIILLFTLITFNAYSQCSDAGVCVIGKHVSTEFLGTKNTISFGYTYGYSGKDADLNGNVNDISYGTMRIEGDFELYKGLRINAAIPYIFVTGPLGENNGIGDISVTFSRMFTIKKKNQLTFFLGGKFATGKVNSNDSLPQRYMPGLGTNDLIAGALFMRGNYYFGVGYQKPFGRSANNQTRLKRGDDVFFRAGFTELFNKIRIKAEILTILRIQRSSVLASTTPSETFITVTGSNEAQVNLLATAIYTPSDEVSFTAIAVIPFLQRNYNFDGLKRTLTISGVVSYNF